MEAYEAQKLVRAFRDAVSAMIEVEAMKAENKDRELRGESLAYTEKDFIAIQEAYGMHHNGNIDSTTL